MKHFTILQLIVLCTVFQLTNSNKNAVNRRGLSRLFKLFKGKTLKDLLKWFLDQIPKTTTTIPSTSPSTTPAATTTPPMPPGCIQNGRLFPPNSEISRIEDHANNRCHGLYCDQHGQIIPWDQPNCFPTTHPPTTRPMGCEHNGNFYRPGEEISKGVDGNCRSGLYCGDDGHLIAWDSWGCFHSPTSTTTGPPPEAEQTYSNEAFPYSATDRPVHGDSTNIIDSMPEGNKNTFDHRGLSRFFKLFNGKTLKDLLKWFLDQIPKTTTSTTNTSPSTNPAASTTPPMPPGCIHNGRLFPPSSEISIHANNRCHGLYCDRNSQVIPWDQPDCFPTTLPPTTTPIGCYHKGRFYPPGEISRGQDRNTIWCWGYICGTDGHVMTWDNFTCFGTTPPTTTPDTPPEPHSPGAKRNVDLAFFRKKFRR